MRIVHSLDEEQWREFIDKHPESNIFHTPEMFRVFARTKNHSPDLWAVIENSGQVLALFLPVYITLFRKMRILSTRAVSYGGVLYSKMSNGVEALRLLLKDYKKKAGRSVLFTEMRNLSDRSEVQPLLEEMGFMYKEEINYLIDLKRPADQVLQSFGPKTRKHIRRGIRNGEVKIYTMKNKDDLEDWYALLKQTYLHGRVPLADRSLFEAAYDELVPRNMARYIIGKVNGRIVVCAVMLLFKGIIYDWYGGVNRRYGRYTPSEMLVWYEIKWGADNGCRIFDFGLAGDPKEEYGVRDFKAKFRGDEVCYGRNTFIPVPAVFWFVRSGYAAYRNVMRFIK